MTTFNDFLKESGGFDGFMRETELGGAFDLARLNLADFMAERAHTGTFTGDDYDQWKRLQLKLTAAVYDLVRKVRILESGGSSQVTK